MLADVKMSCDKKSHGDIIFYITWSGHPFDALDFVISRIESLFPDSLYYGNETTGNISDGELFYGINVTCYVFEKKSTKVEMVWLDDESELSSLDDLWAYCNKKKNLCAVELISSMTYLDSLKVDGNIPALDENIPVFGGASINYENFSTAADIIAKGHLRTRDGLAAVLYSGSNLQLSMSYILGWKGLGRSMKVTSSSGKHIKEIDGRPPFEIYEKYLNLSLDDNDGLVFPLVLVKNGVEYIKTPLEFLPDKTMRMFADIPQNSKVRIAYGDRNVILSSLYAKVKPIAEFTPQAIKTYSCAGRKMFWGDSEISTETKILNNVAPVSGFYTGGEIMNLKGTLNVLNQTLVIVAFRESLTPSKVTHTFKNKDVDKSLASRLAYFVERVSEEHKASHRQIMEQQAIMRQNMEIIGGMTSDYLALYYVNLKDSTFRVYSVNEDRLADTKILLSQDDDAFSLIRRFARSSAVHPDDRALFDDLTVENVRKRFSGVKKFTIRFRRDYGQGYRWSEMDAVKYEAPDEEANAISIGFADRDNEIRREQELAVERDLANQHRHIEAFSDMINAGVWSIEINEDDEVTGVLWSDKSKHMLGYTNENDMSDTLAAWVDLLHPEDRDRVLSYLRDCISEKRTGKIYDVRYRTRKTSGEYCWIRACGCIEKNEDGTRRMYGIIVDISADKKLEEQQAQLEEALIMAQSASRSKTLFLNSMSHDIRTPMNAIMGYTSLIDKCIDDKEKILAYLGKINVAGNTLLELVNQVLDMSRIESGKIVLSEGTYDVVGKAYEMCEIVGNSAQVKNIKINTEIKDVNDRFVYADGGRMNQLAMNILGNAIKYTPEGGTIVHTVTQVASDRSGYGKYVFTTEDNGIGMSKEFLNSIFEPFSRENTSTVSKIQGAGLGMSIVKKLVDLMGGDIKIESEPWKGTRISITLSFRLAQKEESRQDTAGNMVYDGALRGKRVLLVEDNEMNREIATMLLKDQGLVVDTAEDGDIAVEIMRQLAEKGEWKYYDFILMDVQMPRMTGYTATTAIRILMAPGGVHIPIIAMTANVFAEDKRTALASGMDDHIAKPIDARVLWKTLTKYI